MFTSRFILIALMVVAGFLTVNYARAYYQDYKIRQEILALQNEVKHLEQKKIQSLKILDYVTSDAFVEEKARTELNMKKPGEHAAVITGNETDTSTVHPAENDTHSRYLSNPKKWWYYITHHSPPQE